MENQVCTENDIKLENNKKISKASGNQTWTSTVYSNNSELLLIQT